MATIDLTPEEIELIKTSLGYTRQAFSDYDGYPDEAFRRQQVERVDDLLGKLSGRNT